MSGQSNNPVAVQENGLTPDFSNEFSEIDSEINDLECLYQDSKQILDQVKASRARGSLTFVANQTANLISLKNAKLAAIKEKVNIKNTRFNQEFKRLTGNILNDDADIPVSKLMELFAKHKVDYKNVQTVDAEVIPDDFDSQVDKALDGEDITVSTDEKELEIIKNKEMGLPDPEVSQEFKAKTEAYQVVADITGNIYVIDLVSSTDDDVVLIDNSVLGILPEDVATIEDNGDGMPIAKYKNVELEIVDFEE